MEFTGEQRSLRSTVRTWVNKEFPKNVALDLEAQGEYPEELWDGMSNLGLHAIGIDEEFGGAGGGVVEQHIVARELSRSLAGLAGVWATPSFIGSKAIQPLGTENQKRQFLPELAKGALKFAIAITEPDGGTDLLGALKTTGTKTDKGWVLSGQKIWSTTAHIADYLLVLARTDKDAAKKTEGTTLFLVPREADGITTRLIPKLGFRSVGSCEVFIDEVEVPDDLVLGEPGNGFRGLLATLNNERVQVASLALGMIDGVIEEALSYVQQRYAFGKPIGQFQSIQHYIADMVCWQKQAELMVENAVHLQSQPNAQRLELTMAVLVASTYAVDAADLGIQIMGGMGYSAETHMQRYWRDARLFKLGPFSHEMSKNSIAEDLGLPRSY